MPEPMTSSAAGPPRSRWSWVVFLLPLMGFFALAIMFRAGLGIDPTLVPSPLIGKPVPRFSLPAVKGHRLGLSSGDLLGHVSLVNVFASWCVACREEHPLLMALAAQRTVPIYGIDYKDQPDDAEHWLDANGDPYARTGADIGGRVAIDWGVYGVPETFVINRRGHIAYKQIGPITPKVLARTILPLIAKLRQGSGSAPAVAGR